jgi:SAM-dependent methyltransferase
MNRGLRSKWEARHRGASAGGAERSLIEILPLLPRGIALDVAAGTGRDSLALARAGLRVVAADFSATAMRGLHEAARQHRLPISTVVTDFEEGFPFRPQTFDAIINVSFLERGLVPHLKNALRAGGILFFDTFLTDQAEFGDPRDPRFLLTHYELYGLLADMELLRYQEGIVVHSGDKREWRATALARRGS